MNPDRTVQNNLKDAAAPAKEASPKEAVLPKVSQANNHHKSDAGQGPVNQHYESGEVRWGNTGTFGAPGATQKSQGGAAPDAHAHHFLSELFGASTKKKKGKFGSDYPDLDDIISRNPSLQVVPDRILISLHKTIAKAAERSADPAKAFANPGFADKVMREVFQNLKGDKTLVSLYIGNDQTELKKHEEMRSAILQALYLIAAQRGGQTFATAMIQSYSNIVHIPVDPSVALAKIHPAPVVNAARKSGADDRIRDDSKSVSHSTIHVKRVDDEKAKETDWSWLAEVARKTKEKEDQERLLAILETVRDIEKKQLERVIENQELNHEPEVSEDIHFGADALTTTKELELEAEHREIERKRREEAFKFNINFAQVSQNGEQKEAALQTVARSAEALGRVQATLLLQPESEARDSKLFEIAEKSSRLEKSLPEEPSEYALLFRAVCHRTEQHYLLQGFADKAMQLAYDERFQEGRSGYPEAQEKRRELERTLPDFIVRDAESLKLVKLAEERGRLLADTERRSADEKLSTIRSITLFPDSESIPTLMKTLRDTTFEQRLYLKERFKEGRPEAERKNADPVEELLTHFSRTEELEELRALYDPRSQGREASKLSVSKEDLDRVLPLVNSAESAKLLTATDPHIASAQTLNLALKCGEGIFAVSDSLTLATSIAEREAILKAYEKASGAKLQDSPELKNGTDTEREILHSLVESGRASEELWKREVGELATRYGHKVGQMQGALQSRPEELSAIHAEYVYRLNRAIQQLGASSSADMASLLGSVEQAVRSSESNARLTSVVETTTRLSSEARFQELLSDKTKSREAAELARITRERLNGYIKAQHALIGTDTEVQLSDKSVIKYSEYFQKLTSQLTDQGEKAGAEQFSNLINRVDNLHRSLHGTWSSVGLGKDTVNFFGAFDGATPAERSWIERVYEQQYGRSVTQQLDFSLNPGAKRDRAYAMLRGDRVAQLAAECDLALTGFYVGSGDGQVVRGAIKEVSSATDTRVKSSFSELMLKKYSSEISKDKKSTTITELLSNSRLNKNDRDIAVATISANPIRALALEVKGELSKVRPNIPQVTELLSKLEDSSGRVSPSTLKKFQSEYASISREAGSTHTDVSGDLRWQDRYSREWIAAILSDGYQSRSQRKAELGAQMLRYALAKGDEKLAYRAYESTERGGDRKQLVSDSAALRQEIGTRFKALQGISDFEATKKYLSQKEAKYVSEVKASGIHSDINKLHEALTSFFVDSQAVISILSANSDREKMAKLTAGFKETHNADLRDLVDAKLHRANNFDALELIDHGPPQSVEERISAVKRRTEFELSGWARSSIATAGGASPVGLVTHFVDKDMLAKSEKLKTELAKSLDAQGKIKESERKKIELLAIEAMQSCEAHRVVNNYTKEIGKNVGATVVVIGGTVLVVSSGGSLLAVAGVAAGGGFATRAAVETAFTGSGYFWDGALKDAGVSAVEGASTLLMIRFPTPSASLTELGFQKVGTKALQDGGRFITKEGAILTAESLGDAAGADIAKAVGQGIIEGNALSRILLRAQSGAIDGMVLAVPSGAAQVAFDRENWRNGVGSGLKNAAVSGLHAAPYGLVGGAIFGGYSGIRTPTTAPKAISPGELKNIFNKPPLLNPKAGEIPALERGVLQAKAEAKLPVTMQDLKDSSVAIANGDAAKIEGWVSKNAKLLRPDVAETAASELKALHAERGYLTEADLNRYKLIDPNAYHPIQLTETPLSTAPAAEVPRVSETVAPAQPKVQVKVEPYKPAGDRAPTAEELQEISRVTRNSRRIHSEPTINRDIKPASPVESEIATPKNRVAQSSNTTKPQNQTGQIEGTLSKEALNEAASGSPKPLRFETPRDEPVSKAELLKKVGNKESKPVNRIGKFTNSERTTGSTEPEGDAPQINRANKPSAPPKKSEPTGKQSEPPAKEGGAGGESEPPEFDFKTKPKFDSLGDGDGPTAPGLEADKNGGTAVLTEIPTAGGARTGRGNAPTEEAPPSSTSSQQNKSRIPAPPERAPKPAPEKKAIPVKAPPVEPAFDRTVSKQELMEQLKEEAQRAARPAKSDAAPSIKPEPIAAPKPVTPAPAPKFKPVGVPQTSPMEAPSIGVAGANMASAKNNASELSAALSAGAKSPSSAAVAAQARDKAREHDEQRGTTSGSQYAPRHMKVSKPMVQQHSTDVASTDPKKKQNPATPRYETRRRRAMKKVVNGLEVKDVTDEASIFTDKGPHDEQI